jgi:hypothetical protein
MFIQVIMLIHGNTISIFVLFYDRGFADINLLKHTYIYMDKISNPKYFIIFLLPNGIST